MRRALPPEVDLPVSSPAGAPPLVAEGVDELDIVVTVSSLLPASLDTVIVADAGFRSVAEGPGGFVLFGGRAGTGV